MYSKISIWSHCAKLKYTVYDVDDQEASQSPGEPAGVPASTGRVATQEGRLNVRKQPSTAATILGRLEKDSVVTLLEKRDGWYRISQDGLRGWVSGAYIEEIPDRLPTFAFSAYGLSEAQALSLKSLAETLDVTFYLEEEGED